MEKQINILFSKIRQLEKEIKELKESKKDTTTISKPEATIDKDGMLNIRYNVTVPKDHKTPIKIDLPSYLSSSLGPSSISFTKLS
jgi:hypothetical protein